MTTTPELLPCPFCGNSECYGSTVNGRVFCEDCGSEGPWSPYFDGDWNTRAAAVAADPALLGLEAAPDHAPALAEVLRAFVDEQCDYMRINKLGDPEKQHNIKWARSVLAAYHTSAQTAPKTGRDDAQQTDSGGGQECT